MSLQPFVQCSRCGCLRPRSAVRWWPPIEDLKPGTGFPALQCKELPVCSRMAGVGQGQLDADVGGPDVEVRR